MFLVGLLLLFVLSSAQTVLKEIIPGIEYYGKIGVNKTTFRFIPNTHQYRTSLFNIHFTALSNSSQGKYVPVQLIVQDQRSRLFSIVQAPAIYQGKVVAEYGVGTLCNTSEIIYYDMLPAGASGAEYKIFLSIRTRRLSLGEQIPSTLIDLGEGSISWFYFDLVDISAPIQLTVTSDDDVDTKLIALPTECPTRFVEATIASITWSRSGTMMLSKDLTPKIQQSRWFFGISHGTNRSQKDFNISISTGSPYSSYLEYHIIPPFVALAIVLLCLGIGLLITRTLHTRIGPVTSFRRRFTWDYSKLTLSVGLVFLVPGIQYVLEEVDLMSVTGDRDLCYYNEKCMKPSPPSFDLSIPAWNNVYSNICYVIAGVGFIVYIYVFRWFSRRDHITAGLPLNSSIPYAMGVAVALEGFSSALYHWCPSRLIFQFDTANMFVIMILGLCEIWRRCFFKPDGATVFSFVAVLLLVNFIGSMTDSTDSSYRDYDKVTFTWILFTILTIFFFFFLFPYMMKKTNQRYFDFYSRSSLSAWVSRPPKLRIFIFLVLYVANSGVLLYLNLVQQSDFALSLLGMGTLSLSIVVIAYEFYNLQFFKYAPKTYLAMKGGYLLIFLSLWGGALYYYGLDIYNVRMTPARSRAQNSPCLLGDFYDSHDIWHFISAAGLFVQCLVIFHLDLNATYQGKRIGEWHWVNEETDTNDPHSQSSGVHLNGFPDLEEIDS